MTMHAKHRYGKAAKKMARKAKKASSGGGLGHYAKPQQPSFGSLAASVELPYRPTIPVAKIREAVRASRLALKHG